jgi:hypothetical protein
MRSHRNQASLLVLGKTYAPFKVWRGSTRAEIKSQPLSRREASRLFHDARRFERQTRGFCESRYCKGKISAREGRLGQCGLSVLHAMLFDFLNNRSGRMDPSYASIAHKACVSVRTVARALARLKEAGVLNWVRRCEPDDTITDGQGFVMRQISNLYAVIPATQWRGFKRPADPPPPDPSSWGKTPPIAIADSIAAGDKHGQAFLEASPEGINQALARLGKRLFR